MDARHPPDPSPWAPFESRRRARDEKREAVLRTAVQLFLEQGYHRATLNDVAERLNITKPALYNYFRSKEEILFECWALGQERVDDCIAEIEAERRHRPCQAAQTGARLCGTHGDRLWREPGPVRRPRDLTEENRKSYARPESAIDLVFRSYIAQGIADGSIRPCDVKLSLSRSQDRLTGSGIGIKHGGALSADAVADEFAVRLTEGLESNRERRLRRRLRKQNDRAGRNMMNITHGLRRRAADQPQRTWPPCSATGGEPGAKSASASRASPRGFARSASTLAIASPSCR